MKKNTAKAAAKTPAPANKAVIKPAKKTAAAPVKKATPVAPAPVVAAPVAKAAPPVVKKTAPGRSITVISAGIDVGFGNSLYLRGEGPGLSWEKGVLLDCVADDCWRISLAESEKPVVCKFLLNDVAWSIGNDYLIAPGTSVTLTPTF